MSGEDAPSRSYYGTPILQRPAWELRRVAGYFFLGGLAGASSVLAAGAQLTGRTRLARRLKVGALGALGLSTAALIDDLGRPERFAMMLRVFRPTSPMSVGSWLLAAYGPAAGTAALTAVTGRLPRVGSAATAGAAAIGPGIASYTAVLLADTAVPFWNNGFRQLPFVFTGSAAASAGGLGLLTAPVEEAGPARRAALFGAGLELAASQALRTGLGDAAPALVQGPAAGLHEAARGLTLAGAVGAVLGRRSRMLSALSGLALLAGSAFTRFAVFAAGQESTVDPGYVVGPQRARIAARQAEGDGSHACDSG
ncbi:MAG TPA: NrfD/PsrC family molybdoenzyme membrane anchor subunit [Kineosporiaceae bacterium]|nr:NrfD/PsrC family molybdoenzyme membrane anchor subunit [Kineosporiaceae bacterium]